MKDYLIIQDKQQELGQIAISTSVVNEIILNTIDQDKNIHLDEIRGLKTIPVVELSEESLNILLKVRVQYGQDVESSCKNLREELRKQFELMLDYHNPIINFNVVGFKFD